MQFVLYTTTRPLPDRPTVPATPAVLVGWYDRGELWRPDPVAVRAALPYRWRKAFDRAGSFWYDNANKRAPYVVLRDHRGRPMLTLYAVARRLST